MKEQSMDKQVITKEDTTTLDDLFGGDGVVPGLDPDAGVEGGVDPSKEDDNCPGGACKI